MEFVLRMCHFCYKTFFSEKQPKHFELYVCNSLAKSKLNNNDTKLNLSIKNYFVKLTKQFAKDIQHL